MKQKNKNTKIGKKGQYQYIACEKKRRIIRTILMFLPSIALLITGLVLYKDRNNWFTIGAVLACLPACKQMVGIIMIFMYQSMTPTFYEKVCEKQGSLTMLYETILTNYEKNVQVDAFAICGNQVVGYTSNAKADVKYAEKNTMSILKHNGYDVKVKVFKDERKFLEQLDHMNRQADTLRANIEFIPDERYPDLSREELIRHTILAISL